MDTVIQLKHPSDYSAEQGARFVVTFEKNRGFYGEDAAPLEASLITDDDGSSKWKTSKQEDTNYERVIELKNEGEMSQTDIAKELEIHRATVSKLVKKAREAGRIMEKQPSGVQQETKGETNSASASPIVTENAAPPPEPLISDSGEGNSNSPPGTNETT